VALFFQEGRKKGKGGGKKGQLPAGRMTEDLPCSVSHGSALTEGGEKKNSPDAGSTEGGRPREADFNATWGEDHRQKWEGGDLFSQKEGVSELSRKKKGPTPPQGGGK